MNKIRISEKGVEEWNPSKEQWERVAFKTPPKGNAIVKPNNKTMKYRVKTDKFEGIEKGTVVKSSGQAQGIAYFPGDNKWYANEHYINAHKEYFEPVEEAQEGDYLRYGKSIYRIHTVKDHGAFPYKAKLVAGNARHEEDAFNEAHVREGKLSTHDIEQALVKEAKRRGFDKDGVCYYDAGWEGALQKELKFEYLEYDRDLDWLTDGWGHVIYKEGEFSEIVDQTPDIEINGNKVEFNDHPKVGCTTIKRKVFIEQAKTIARHGVRIHRKGEDITDQILAIASHYGYEPDLSNTIGEPVASKGSFDGSITWGFSSENMWGNND